MSWYLWVKALHLISVIAWMAGLLYLPRRTNINHQSDCDNAHIPKPAA